MENIMQDSNDLRGLLGDGAGQLSEENLNALLGTLFGGGERGSLGGLLGSLLGDESAPGVGGMGSPMDALTGPLAERLGIAKEHVAAILAAIVARLMAGDPDEPAELRIAGIGGASVGSVEADLVEIMREAGASPEPVEGNQLAQELVQRTGLDEATIARVVQEGLLILSGKQGLNEMLRLLGS